MVSPFKVIGLCTYVLSDRLPPAYRVEFQLGHATEFLSIKCFWEKYVLLLHIYFVLLEVSMMWCNQAIIVFELKVQMMLSLMATRPLQGNVPKVPKMISRLKFSSSHPHFPTYYSFDHTICSILLSHWRRRRREVLYPK